MKRYIFPAAIAALVLGTAPAHAELLETDMEPDNGSGGVWLTLTDLTPEGEYIAIDQITLGGMTGDPGTSVDIEIYTRQGEYGGVEQDSGSWTLHDTVSITREGEHGNTDFTLSQPILVQDEAQTSIYLQALSSEGIRYSGTGANPPQIEWENDDLHLFSDAATTSDEAFTGSFFQPRTFSGSIHYDVVPEPGSLALIGLGGIALLSRRRSNR